MALHHPQRDGDHTAEWIPARYAADRVLISIYLASESDVAPPGQPTAWALCGCVPFAGRKPPSED
jgi:hypothetical protein